MTNRSLNRARGITAASDLADALEKSPWLREYLDATKPDEMRKLREFLTGSQSDGCPCADMSWTGADDRPLGAHWKLWRCDTCGRVDSSAALEERRAHR